MAPPSRSGFGRSGFGKRSRWVVLGVLACGFGVWWAGQGGSAAERVLTYTVEAQKQGGTAYGASATEIFHAGDRFRLRLESPQSGFVYVINEGPGSGGKTRFWILAAAPLNGGQAMETPWYAFDPNPGTERLWLAFATGPVAALGQAGEVTDAAQEAKVREFLNGLARPVRTVLAGSGVRLQAAEGVPGDVIELRHQ